MAEGFLATAASSGAFSRSLRGARIALRSTRASEPGYTAARHLQHGSTAATRTSETILLAPDGRPDENGAHLIMYGAAEDARLSAIAAKPATSCAASPDLPP